MEPVEIARHRRIAAVHRKRVLRQVVGADREEVGLAGEQVGGDRGGGRLDHDPERDGVGMADRAGCGIERGADGAEFGEARDHRHHDAALACGADREDRAQLCVEHLGVREPDADSAQAERGILFRGDRKIRRRLVAADVEQADDQRAAVERGGYALVIGGLFLDARRAVAFEEEEFGAQQPAAFGAVADRGLGVVGRAEIGEGFDADAVLRAAFARGVGEGGAAAFGLCVVRGLRGCERIGIGRDVEQTRAGVEDQWRAGGDLGKRRAYRDQGGEAHRRGEDRDVRGRPAALDAKADDRCGVEAEQMRGEQIVRQQDRAGREAQALVEVFAGQCAQHLAFEVEHVVGALGEARVAGCFQRIGLCANRGAPGVGGAVAGGDRGVGGAGERGIVE